MKVRAAEDLSTALYCRLSVDDGEEGDSNSIVNQKKMLGDYAESHGYFNPKFYTDDGYSGTNFNRPGFHFVASYNSFDKSFTSNRLILFSTFSVALSDCLTTTEYVFLPIFFM